MTEQTASELREQAARCRRLAAATFEQRTHDILKQAAEDFDCQASEREAAQRGRSGAVEEIPD